MSNARILVVDDEKRVATYIRDTLQSLGYGIAGLVYSGEEAIQKAGETRPDLILMDILLGGTIDGVAAAETISKLYKIPVVFLTAFSDERTLQRAKKANPYGFVVKPFEERELNAAIEYALVKAGVITTPTVGPNPTPAAAPAPKSPVSPAAAQAPKPAVAQAAAPAPKSAVAQAALAASAAVSTVAPAVTAPAAPAAAQAITKTVTMAPPLPTIPQNGANLSIILNSIADAVIAADAKGTVSFMNPTAEKLTGWSIQESTGKSMGDIFKIVDQRVSDSGESSIQMTIRDHGLLLTRSGEKIPIDYSAAMIRDSRGQAGGYVLTFRDVAERQKVEDALRESRRRYKDLVNSIEGIVWEAEGAGRQFSFVSKQALRILGYPVEHWTRKGSFWEDVVHPDDRTRVIAETENAINTKQDCEMEYRIVAENGSNVWVKDVINVVQEDSQLRLRGVIVDITELKRAEETLKKAHDELEKRVAERTVELSQAVANLQEQIHERRRAETALGESETKYRSLIESMSEGLLQVDNNDVIQFVNTSFCQMVDYDREELLGQTAYELLLLPEDRTHLRERSRARIEQKTADVYEVKLRKKYAEIIWVQISGSPVFDANGLVSGSIAILTDITTRKKAEEALRESEERYALAAKGANDGLWDWNLRKNKVYYSPRWKAMLGANELDIGSSTDEWFKRVHPDDLPQLQADISAHLEGLTPHFENEHRMTHDQGHHRWMLSRGIAVRDTENKAYRMAGSMTDITERKQAVEQLLHDAFHDALTGLSNRALFMDRLSGALARTKRRGDFKFAVLFIDLDRFKVVNDSLGHMCGDELLVAIAKRLSTSLRPGDSMARLGGDEFALLLEDISDVNDATRVAERVQNELRQPFTLNEHEVFTTASIGIALSTSGYERPEEMLRDADTAMYRAKALGKARHEVFDKLMHARAVALLRLETDLRRAVERNEFLIHYQPIIELKKTKVVGFEALVRWNHPEAGLVYPLEWIPVAEETGLIIPIGSWVITESCKQMNQWLKRKLAGKNFSVSVNLSGKQFSQPDLIEQIEQTLGETGLNPKNLKFEITESVVMENAQFATDMLHRLKALEVRLQIDDFGTGYSSLSYLQRFPVDTLKIDSSFISRLGTSDENMEIVRAIILLAHNLNMEVIAEGVETAEQLAQLRTLGCQYAQGYYFSRAVDAETAKRLLPR